jgi:hypothetical protein
MASTVMKLLVPLSTAMVAGAVALGSGATWTSESATSISVTGGNILHETNAGTVGLTVTELKPGASVTGTVRLTNTGDLDSLVSLVESNVVNGFQAGAAPNPAADWLQLKIVATSPELTSGPVTVYDAPLGSMGTTSTISGLTLQAVDAGTDEYVDLAFTLRLPGNTPNDFQGKVSTATYTFVTTQTGAVDNLPAGNPDGNDDEADVTGWPGSTVTSTDPTS